MKRLESSVSPPCFLSNNRLIALIRQQRFETRLLPLQFVVWLGIALSVGIGIAALGMEHLPVDDTHRQLTHHFVKTPSFGALFGRLCLSLLPICFLWSGLGFAYRRFVSFAALFTAAAEGLLSGACLFILLRGAYPLLWVVVYATWRLLRVMLILYMVIQARVMAHQRQESKWLIGTGGTTTAPRTRYLWICLIEWLCGTVICAITGGLYLLINV